MTAAILGGSALPLAAAFVGIAGLGDLTEAAVSFVVLFALGSVAYFVAVARVLQRPHVGRWGLAGIIGAGLVFRLILLPIQPTLSTDLYRYLWDGRLAVAGVSPYRYPPDAPELTTFRDRAVYPWINHADWLTIYPPGAQLLFAALARAAPGSVAAFKLVMVAFDLLALGALLAWLRALGRPPAWAIVYAWHPLVVVELAGSGHLDAVALAASVAALWAAARGREGWAGACLGLGAAVKLYPLLLLPAIWERRPGRMAAAAGGVLAAAYAVYAGDGLATGGSLLRYLAEEHFNPTLRGLLEPALGRLGEGGRHAARAVPLAGLAAFAIALAVWGRAVPAWRRALWLVSAYLVTTPSLFPWYALWIVPLLAAAPAWPWLYLSCAVGLTYLVFAQPVWRLPSWVVAVEFVPLAAGLALAAWSRTPASGGLMGRNTAPSWPRASS
jgi:alpha-1,6-mannosyltransferase